MFVRDNDQDYQAINVTSRDDLRPALPAGAYQANIAMGVIFRPVAIRTEPFVKLDTPIARKVLREVGEFFNPELTARLASAGLKHRRGIILHGPPGTGKTSLVRSLFPSLIERGAVILVDPNADHLQNYVIPALRRNDPDRPVVLFFDEFEKNANYSQSELLMLLDGINSPDHLLTIGCTNHLDKIPAQLRSRPSRFSLVLELAALGAEARMTYVANKYPMLDEATRAFVVEVTANLALDYVEEACKLALMGYEPDELRDRVAGAGAVLVSRDGDGNDDEDDD